MYTFDSKDTKLLKILSSRSIPNSTELRSTVVQADFIVAEEAGLVQVQIIHGRLMDIASLPSMVLRYMRQLIPILRYITWFYAGVSAGTARNCLAQYVAMVGKWGFLPMTIRADRGAETTLMAGAHYWLSLPVRQQGDITQPFTSVYRARQQVPALENDGLPGTPVDQADPEPIEFEDCWSYRTSMRNMRIESWWGRLCEGRSKFWRVRIRPISKGFMLIVREHRNSLPN